MYIGLKEYSIGQESALQGSGRTTRQTATLACTQQGVNRVELVDTDHTHKALYLGSRTWAIAGTIVITVVAFLAAWALPVWPGDEKLLVSVQSWQSPLMTLALGAITNVGWYPVAATLTLGSLAPLLWRKRVGDALMVVTAASSSLATHGLKVLLGRPRPDYAIVEQVPQSMGFPSGHAAFAMLLGGVLIYLVWQHVEYPPLRWAVCVALALLVLAVGLSRIYLGVHWPSDVLGGYLFGASALPVFIVLKDHLEGRLAPGEAETPLSH